MQLVGMTRREGVVRTLFHYTILFCLVFCGCWLSVESQRDRAVVRGGTFLDCLRRSNLRTDGRHSAEDMTAIRALFRRCLDAHQNRCSNPARLQMVQAHPWGFGSAMNLWIQSFANALEMGLVMLPTGPFNYADPQLCPPLLSPVGMPAAPSTANGAGAPAAPAAPAPGLPPASLESSNSNSNSSSPLRFPGPECYFRRLTRCNETSQPVILAKSFAKKGLGRGRGLLVAASRALRVSPGWVWGNLAAYVMELTEERGVRDEVLRRSAPEGLGFQGRRQSVGLHMRLGSAEAPITDGRKRPRLTIDDFMRNVEAMTQRAANLDVYVITDQPGVTAAALAERYRRDALRSTHRFLLPDRKVADLGHFAQVDAGVFARTAAQRSDTAAAAHSVADVSLDLIADVEVLSKHVDYFVGSHSNLFFLVYGLRLQDGERAERSCWVNTEFPGAPLNCPNGKGGGFRRSYDVGGLLALPLGNNGAI